MKRARALGRSLTAMAVFSVFTACGSDSRSPAASAGSPGDDGALSGNGAPGTIGGGPGGGVGGGAVTPGQDGLPPDTIAQPGDMPLSGPTGPFADEDGHELWLRYPQVWDAARLGEYRAAFMELVALADTPTLAAAQKELARGLGGLVGAEPARAASVTRDGSIVLGTSASPALAGLPALEGLAALGPEGFIVRRAELDGHAVTLIAGNGDVGVLYGSFALLRQLSQYKPLEGLELAERPKIARRLLNHWDNLDGSVERGYAGRSLWDWASLPGTLSPRYEDYARANASIGINGTVLTNVNANAQVLTPAYLDKVQALADVFRPYGIRVYLTARFSAPIEIGGLTSADPAAADVQAWWRGKADEIYQRIPDFGGFLVKANSEGQPGPQQYGRTHADGANLLADALAPHGGVVIWRAFVYDAAVMTDRIRQAYDEFQPLDGAFRGNVIVQVKNGPLDFQPREPFSPLFGAMPATPLALELQVTKEYLGEDTHLAYLGPLYEEVLDADTQAAGVGSTVARVVEGALDGHSESAIAGVANIGSDVNWTGSHMNQANWYVFGRLAWDPELGSEAIAEEWVRETFSNDSELVSTVTPMLQGSREAVVSYMTPLGLAHIMRTDHHYGPGPWVDDLSRPDWNPVYYHRADTTGIGYDRTAAGSNAVEQYAQPVQDELSNRATIPDELLLFFHHVGWTETMRSGRTLWDELVDRYTSGVAGARALGTTWQSVEGKIDARRFGEVAEFLRIQGYEAKWWRDAALTYFGQFSGLPLPEGYEPPSFSLDFYRNLTCPTDVTKPRCEPVYVDAPAPGGG
jgi:alpha-glucuronidase